MTIATTTAASNEPTAAPATDETGSLTDRLFESTIGALEMISVHLGVQLGLYAELAAHERLTEGELAAAAGIAPRYAREWLEQQAVAGFVTVDDPQAGPVERRYALPIEHRAALVDAEHGDHVAPFAAMIVGIANVLDEVIDAYRTGGGVPYVHYGSHFRHGQGGINRPAFSDDLVTAWLPATDGVVDKLAAGGRVADVGCGHGWSTIAMQRAWPQADVIGIDPDAPSIADARANAEVADVDVHFAATTIDASAELGPFDVVTVLEALHDMAQPAEVLASVRRCLADDGIVVIADEAVSETFVAPGDELERMMYGWSVSHCLPAAMAEQPSAAIGTAIRPATVAELATEAGFARCEVVDVDGGFFRIYRLSI
ncbi:MAG: class I SAM-dependent methyltransferase [Actinomycetota bacterium]